MRRVRRALAGPERDELRRRLGEALEGREEIRFACLHGSVLGSHGFRDVDVAVWVDAARVPPEAAMDYEFALSAVLERHVRLPVDVQVLNHAPLGFRYAVTSGEPVQLRDPGAWFEFRARTWRDYLDFAPLARAALFDLLGAAPVSKPSSAPSGTAEATA